MCRVPDFSVVLRAAVVLFLMSDSGAVTSAENGRQAAVVLEAPLTLLQATTTISPPTLRFSREGQLHVAWIEKSGGQGEVTTAQVPAGQSAATPVRVSPAGGGPEAVHQSPGFAIGTDGAQFVTWSSAHRAPGSLFASALKLARPADGHLLQAPAQVTDDGLALP